MAAEVFNQQVFDELGAANFTPVRVQGRPVEDFGRQAAQPGPGLFGNLPEPGPGLVRRSGPAVGKPVRPALALGVRPAADGRALFGQKALKLTDPEVLGLEGVTNDLGDRPLIRGGRPVEKLRGYGVEGFKEPAVHLINGLDKLGQAVSGHWARSPQNWILQPNFTPTPGVRSNSGGLFFVGKLDVVLDPDNAPDRCRD